MARIFIAIISLLLSLPLLAQDVNVKINESLLFKNRAETEKWLVKNHIPALGIGFIQDGKIREVTVYGRDEKGKPLPKNTIFNVGSLTKPITATVALELVNGGKWDLDIPVYHYWADPDIAPDPRTIELTMRQMLSHTTGFPNWRRDSQDGKLTFEFTPGTKYQYSGEGYEYLRNVLERRFEKSISKLAGEWIFEPLKMKDSHFFWDSTVDEKRIARPHKGDGSMYETEKNATANGADGMLSTVEDYCKFMVYILNGAGLSEDIYKQMISEQARITPRKYSGLGWWVDENVNNGENALVHGGSEKGIHTFAYILPKSKRGLVIFTNCDNGVDIDAAVLLHYLGTSGQGIIDIERK